jgi:hypothetical protein
LSGELRREKKTVRAGGGRRDKKIYEVKAGDDSVQGNGDKQRETGIARTELKSTRKED